MRSRWPILLLGGALALAVPAVVGCGGREEAARTAETVEPQPPTVTERAATARDADPEAGKRVFMTAGCGDCHTLRAAASKGTVGPNLDEHFSEPHHEHAFQEIVERVRDGGGGMPAFKDRLSEKQIRDVAAFVVDVTEQRR